MNRSYQEKALQTYQKMEDNGNTTLEVRLNIAMLQYQLRDFTDAMETLQALKTDYPKDYRVYKWLAYPDVPRPPAYCLHPLPA